jgi:hypothetical protein
MCLTIDIAQAYWMIAERLMNDPTTAKSEHRALRFGHI